ncbi:MAG: hypothetical protein VCC04_04735, partial [Myxococcota bacterium]
MGRLARTLAAGLALVTGLALDAQSREVWQDDEAHLGLGGELRLIGLVGRGTSETDFWGPFRQDPAGCGISPPSFDYDRFINCPG